MPRGRPKKSQDLVEQEENLSDNNSVKTIEEIKAPTLENFQKGSEDGEYSINISKDFYGHVDPFYLGKTNPAFRYRFLYIKHENLFNKTNNQLLQKGGWCIVNKAHVEKYLPEYLKDIGPDGLLRRGDQVLSFMPIEFYNEKQKHKDERNKAPMKAVKRLLDDGDANNPELKGLGHNTQKGLQTAKQLGFK